MTIKKYCPTLRAAERHQKSLYNRYRYVRLISWPVFNESGYYVWEIGRRVKR